LHFSEQGASEAQFNWSPLIPVKGLSEYQVRAVLRRTQYSRRLADASLRQQHDGTVTAGLAANGLDSPSTHLRATSRPGTTSICSVGSAAGTYVVGSPSSRRTMFEPCAMALAL